MKTIETKNGKILVVEVPEEVTHFDWYGCAGKIFAFYDYKFKIETIILGYENYRIIGKLSELTNEECEKFVEFIYPFDGQYKKIYENYSHVPLEPWNISTYYNSAKQSFISLLQSEGIDTTKEQLIIEVL